MLRAMRRQSALGVAHRHHLALHGRGLVLWVWPRGSERHRQHPAELLRGDPSSRRRAGRLHHVSLDLGYVFTQNSTSCLVAADYSSSSLL